MVRIRRTSKLYKFNFKELWHREVVGLLHVLGVVGTVKLNVVMARHVTLSVVNRVTS